MKKYLSLGVVLAGSALMISCDDTGDDVYVTEDTGVADAINNQTDQIGNKPVAPILLAEYPITSLKLTFDNAAGACLGASFAPGDELEIDFDSVNVTSREDTTANGQADLDFTPGGAFSVVFGMVTTEGYVEGITSDTAAPSFTIDSVYAGTNNSGSLILSGLTFTPYASDQRSVTGRFTASAPIDVNINQDTENVVDDAPGLAGVDIDLPGAAGTAPVTKITSYKDVAGNPAEVQPLTGEVVYEDKIGTGNIAVSLFIGTGDACVVNFVMSQSQYDSIVLGDLPTNAAALVAVLDLNLTLDVSPAGNDIPSSIAAPRYMIAGNVAGGVTGSYRHDYDSSFGTAETIINSESERN